ncbi:MAG: NAD(P)H-hydrate epimerase [Tabrizicola sp.]|uniref:NAD(P)H-hydrate epimerase n=1 Tax=Tabrizicola sp. TaxID=2005166 RepID=UPI0027350C1B|nr:NAD(P)H-hydrate epimerase [Tabrizicola sp.]MDP3264982.1 NAD(P)H-hydrate epimerase [Tabrizicola sp.]MDP3647475.1 NAD(P)H-hydrate epimerase [Paracoccaceae bacterium]
MTELLTAAQMRAIEAAAIASGEVTGLELMERAGRGVVEAIFEEWPELRATSHRAVVLCGPGNNGGDGFVVARLLQEWGWDVEVFLYGDPERMPPDARVNYERWVGMGTISPHDRAAPDFLGCDGLVIDAVFGTGLSRPLSGDVEKFVRAMARQGVGVSIDLPSGFCADSGRYLSAEDPEGYYGPEPQLIVTFQRGRVGHMLDQLARGDARLKTVDIGIDGFVPKRLRNPGGPDDPAIVALTSRTMARRVHEKSVIFGASRPAPHKYSHGHACVLSGPSGRGGAARLAARGALRIGAGVVTVGCPLDAIPEHAARLDAVMLRGVADGEALAAVLADKRINALCLGPGMGVGAREAGLLAVALGLPAGGPPPPSPPHQGEGGRVGPGSTQDSQALPLPRVGRGEGRGATRVVLDADALTILSQHPDLFAALHAGCVLTPHAGEFARLFPDIAEKLAAPATTGPAYSKVDATREAAQRAGCVVLFKGADTVIADPSGRCAINSAHYDRAAPWLATAGSGDVLAGFITGLLARGFSPFDAACTGAWLHVECALNFGPGLIAEDLPEELPKLFRALGL